MSGPPPSCLCGECKKCRNRAKSRLYREQNREAYNAYVQARRAADPERRKELTKAFYHRHRERLLEKNREWREAHPDYEREHYQVRKAKPNWTELNAARQRRYRERYEQKRIAHSRVNDAVRGGHMVPQPCEVCSAEPAEAHHDDYSKPLEVRWLCRAHHRAHHRAQ